MTITSEGDNVDLPEGAFVSTLHSDDFANRYPADIFRKLAVDGIDLERAVALYDVTRIAVLYVRDHVGGMDVDVTYESSNVCSFFLDRFYGKYSKCYTSYSEFELALAATPAIASRSAVVMVTPSDIQAGCLKTPAGVNRFGLLIVPDVMESEYSRVVNALGSAGRTALTEHVQLGGTLYASGKGALVVQGAGIVSGMFETDKLLTASGYACVAKDQPNPADKASNANFEDRVLTFSPYYRLESQPYVYSVGAPVVKTVAAPFRVVDKFAARYGKFKMLNTATGDDLGEVADPQPHIIFGHVGKGSVVLDLANAPQNWNAHYWLFNAVLLAGSRPLILDYDIAGWFDQTIPAMEQLTMRLTLSVSNVFDKVLSNVRVRVSAPVGIDIEEFTGCTLTTAFTPAIGGMNASQLYECTAASFAELTTKNYTATLFMRDIMLTQQKVGIMLAYVELVYIDSSGTPKNTEFPITVNAEVAGHLRGDVNIDPSSYYPLPPRGIYVDNVLDIENKEGTECRNVKHFAIVPIVTPFIDISNQVDFATELFFDKTYYKKTGGNAIADFVYPFTATNQFDYIDFTTVFNRGSFFAINWDEAARLSLVDREGITDVAAQDVRIDSIFNAQYLVQVATDQLLLKQSAFMDADNYFELASQRMHVFYDILDEKARTFHGIASGDVGATIPAKVRILFGRNDVFFWPKVLLPNGVDVHDVISCEVKSFLDQQHPTPLVNPAKPYCKITDPTHMSSTAVTPGKYNQNDGLVYAIWENELLNDCNRNFINMTNVETATGGQAALLPYSVILPEKYAVKEFGDVMDFKATTTANALGEHVLMPWIKFARFATGEFALSPAISRYGGKLVLKLPTDIYDGVDPVATKLVSISSDQIAVDKITFASHEITFWFSRGLMPNEQYGQDSQLKINLQGVVLSAGVNIPLDMYERILSLGETQTYKKRKTVNVSFKQRYGFVMPAVKLEFALNDRDNLEVKPYEYLEPFARYGMYQQEIKHRGIQGTPETHPVKMPSIVVKPGFSSFTHLGISSIPFREFLTKGESQVIPFHTETGRMEWDDVWGRHFSQPLRSTIFEYPPIPPPLRNFIMTTTFEVFNQYGQRMQDWRSDRAGFVHVQMKLYNNYPKYYSPVRCQQTSYALKSSDATKSAHREHWFLPTPPTTGLNPTNKDVVSVTHRSQYGDCFRSTSARMSSVNITESDFSIFEAVKICAPSLVRSEQLACQAANAGTLKISRRPDSETVHTGKLWNFSPYDESYWPNNYIQSNMWDLTHYDYADNWYEKGYHYHMDNLLPHIGIGIRKPHNIVAFPLYKGLGYSLEYSKTTEVPHRFSGRKGWWSDNLQNKDHTLLAQQDRSNAISVNQDSLLPASRWIDVNEMSLTAAEKNHVLKNIYGCLFNRRGVRFDPAKHNDQPNAKNFYFENVVENNVVPIAPDLKDDDPRLTNFNCDVPQYSPTNISEFDNLLSTNTIRDWLYFGANLRGNARETINVIYQIKPIDSVKYEGFVKVQDGGRFVYWNPANGPNSFLVVDNPVSNVRAIRNDGKVESEVFPQASTTFNALWFVRSTIMDEPEIAREFREQTYNKWNGFGDFAVGVFVGGKTDCVLQPGQTTAVKVSFHNNAGFDINMLGSAIDSTDERFAPINSNDLIFRLTTRIAKVTKYNFMTVEIPDALKGHIELTPSEDVVGIASAFFDFQCINVASIRDGFKGDYFYKLKVLPTFPDALRGRPIHLKVRLDTSHFDRFPGKNDNVWIHDYDVTIPDIVFAVPYAAGDFAGKVFETSGYATKLNMKINYYRTGMARDTLLLTDTDLEQLHACDGMLTDTKQCYRDKWAALRLVRPLVKSTSKNLVSDDRLVLDFTDGLAEIAPVFPIPQTDWTKGPDTAVLHLVTLFEAPQMASGFQPVLSHHQLYYNDWMDEAAYVTEIVSRDLNFKGPWLSISTKISLLSDSLYPLAKQQLSPRDSGCASVRFTIANSGDAHAYDVLVKQQLADDVKLKNYTTSYGDLSTGSGFISFKLKDPLTPGASRTWNVVFCFPADKRPDAKIGASSYIFSGHPLVLSQISSMALEDPTLNLDGATAPFKTATVERAKQFYEKAVICPYQAKTQESVLIRGFPRFGGKLELKCSHDAKGVNAYVWRARVPGGLFKTLTVTGSSTSIRDLDADMKKVTGRSDTGGVTLDYAVSISLYQPKSYSAGDPWSSPPILGESNVYAFREFGANLLWLLLLVPAVLLPLIVFILVFLVYRGNKKEPKEEFGIKPNRPVAAPKSSYYESAVVPAAPVEPAPAAAAPVVQPPPAPPALAPAPKAQPPPVPKSKAPKAPKAKKNRPAPVEPEPEPEPVEMQTPEEMPPQSDRTKHKGPAYITAGCKPVYM